MTDHAIDLPIQAFITRWQKAGGSERANYQLFLTELCALLELPQPDPASEATHDNGYVFERRVLIKNPDGSANNGFIDLYKRGSFVLEAKQTGKTLDTSGWDKAMLRAHNQADQYARALPAEEGRPPFILVVDVGRNIELYAEFSRSGATYTPYPDARSHRLRLEDLHRPEIRERLRAVWNDPLSLDPSRLSARVTREIADQLARLAKSLEADGHAPQLVAGFLMRCLFTMFAEDVGLLPERGFTDLLERLLQKPQHFAHMLENLWQTMNTGGFSPILESTLLKFNGGLFAENHVVPLSREQLELLLAASKADWKFVEPAIFGTLLERALNPRERHKLGAHYTPRAYVERLVLPTVMEPLRAEWKEVQAATLTYEQQGKHKEAVAEVKAFHRHLCEIRVLDPACGSGNFLYVTMEHMKRLEGEVLNLLHDLGESQGLLDLQGVTVDPHQFLGLEINPRAAKIAEMVLWIGYLQWHFRTHGRVSPPEPVLRDFRNIENRDALITYEREELVRDESGKPVTRWDGVTFKPSPITGEPIPDEAAQVVQYRYINPKKAEWPKADYIVGNPPFIGASTMRRTLGDGYVDAVRSAWREVPESADFVMHWWHIAAAKVRSCESIRFGFITTNSLKQTFNRRVVQAHIEARNPISLAFAIPDHPWVDSVDGAQVRIAMTVGARCGGGRLLKSISEVSTGGDDLSVALSEVSGVIHSDLKVGVNIASAVALSANSGLCYRGVQPIGMGFVVTKDEAEALGMGRDPKVRERIRSYRNGRDIMDRPRGLFIIDLFGLTSEEALKEVPSLYQWVFDRVKPERDHNKREGYRNNWWIFGEPVPATRRSFSGLDKYIVTTMTAKHRLFSFLSASILPDQKLITVGIDDDFYLGVLSSRVHVAWALATGGNLGVGNDPVYGKGRSFDTFPFPLDGAVKYEKIREFAARIEAHRKRQQDLNPDLTLTGMYNVLEKLRSGEVLGVKEKVIHEQGLVSVLRELHDELDRAVFAAYGWGDLAEKLVGLPGATTPLPDKSDAQAEAEEELLKRLVDLNAQRAAEEAKGLIRWLRPDYQNPDYQKVDAVATVMTDQAEVDLDGEAEIVVAAPGGKQTWPKEMREQVAIVRAALSRQSHTADALAAQFKRSPKVAVQSVLEALEELGMVANDRGSYRLQA